MTRARSLRREAPIVLPAALLLFALLASVTLLSYRTAVDRFSAERERATLKLADEFAGALRVAKSDDVATLARWLPPGGALAVYDARGAVRGSFGFTDTSSLAMPADVSAALAAPRLEGLGSPTPSRSSGVPAMRAFVPYSRGGQRYLLRLDVPEEALAAERRSLAVLTPVVFGLAIAVTVLAIFFLRALMRPYEELLEKARAVAPANSPAPGGDPGPRAGDDVEYLLATFDRALAALRTESPAGAVAGRAGGAAVAETALDELSAVERTLGPQLESGLLMFDRTGGLLAANPAAVELLTGEPLAAGASAPETARAALATHAELAALLAGAIAAARSIPRAAVAIERAGRRIELGLTLQTLRRGNDAGTGGFFVLFADVTDLSRREAEERFEAGLAQLGELSAGVAHELRNSLATVQGYLTLAARRELPAEAREEIAEARREADELARVVDDFLTFARPGSGVLEPIDLAGLLTRATSDPALAGVAVEFTAPEPALPPIAGDPHLLQRALRNLLLNAAQATLARAARDGAGAEPVVVRLRRDATDPDLATITIDDQGVGLTPEIRARLFAPFASGRPGGAGLGLALARRIVLMHGGSLDLAPREPHGARAEIRLPLGEFVTHRYS